MGVRFVSRSLARSLSFPLHSSSLSLSTSPPPLSLSPSLDGRVFGLGGVVYGPVLMNCVPAIYLVLNLFGLAHLSHLLLTYSSSFAHIYE